MAAYTIALGHFVNLTFRQSPIRKPNVMELIILDACAGK
jgi:hypothetical protein